MNLPPLGLPQGFNSLCTYSNAAAIEAVAQKPLNHRDEPGGDSFNAAECEGYVDRLDNVFRRMVAKQPDQRFQSMSEVIAELESLLPRPSFGSTTSPVSPSVGRSDSTTTPQRSPTSAVTLGHESRADVGDTAPSSHSVYEETIISKAVEGLDVQSESATVWDRIVLNHWIADAESSGIQQLMKFARTLQIHREGILNWYDHRISTGPLEGTNNKNKLLQRQAYGYRDLSFFKLKLLALHHSQHALVG